MSTVICQLRVDGSLPVLFDRSDSSCVHHAILEAVAQLSPFDPKLLRDVCGCGCVYICLCVCMCVNFCRCQQYFVSCLWMAPCECCSSDLIQTVFIAWFLRPLLSWAILTLSCRGDVYVCVCVHPRTCLHVCMLFTCLLRRRLSINLTGLFLFTQINNYIFVFVTTNSVSAINFDVQMSKWLMT